MSTGAAGAPGAGEGRTRWFMKNDLPLPEGPNTNLLRLAVMPSFIFSDYGDFLRSGANTGLEDDKNLDNVNFNMEIFQAFTKGYLESGISFLFPIEIENLPYAAALFSDMQCLRFLADYFNGDTYYKILYPEHNLVRTKAQFKLLQSVEEHTPELKKFIDSCI